jgi:hypothetical protein
MNHRMLLMLTIAPRQNAAPESVKNIVSPIDPTVRDAQRNNGAKLMAMTVSLSTGRTPNLGHTAEHKNSRSLTGTGVEIRHAV